NDRVRTVENLFILRPAIEDDIDMQLRCALRETLCEKLRSGIKLVHPRRVRRLSRDDDKLGFSIGGLRVSETGECGCEEDVEEVKCDAHGTSSLDWTPAKVHSTLLPADRRHCMLCK